jgi:hypothetical protein
MVRLNDKTSGQKGSVLLLVVMLISLLVFIPIGTQLLTTARNKVRNFSNADVQALNVARAGLQDAVAWFRRQNNGLPVYNLSQPDAAFYPRNVAANGTSDTEDETRGLVKTGSLSPVSSENKMTYRYEVLRSTDGSNSRAVRDITSDRVDGHVRGEGLVWYIESAGFVYSAAKPGQPIGRARVATEIRRINLTPSAAAAVIISTLNSCALNAGALVAGGPNGIGIAYGARTTTEATWLGTTVGGSTYDARVSGYNQVLSTAAATSIYGTLGVTPYELGQLVDYRRFTDLPAAYPSTALVFLDGPVVFTSTRPLNGGGVLVVNGNMTINANSNTFFTGLILVTGNCVFNGGGTISGSLIVGGTLTITGGTEPAYVFYDQGAIDSASTQLARYRENKATYHAFSAFK